MPELFCDGGELLFSRICNFSGVLGSLRGSKATGLAKNAQCLSGLRPSLDSSAFTSKNNCMYNVHPHVCWSLSLSQHHHWHWHDLRISITWANGEVHSTLGPRSFLATASPRRFFLYSRHLDYHHCCHKCHFGCHHFFQAVISTMKDQLARPNYRTIRMIVTAMRSLDHFSKRIFHFWTFEIGRAIPSNRT